MFLLSGLNYADDTDNIRNIVIKTYYPLVINIDPENSLVLMETNLPTPICQGLC